MLSRNHPAHRYGSHTHEHTLYRTFVPPQWQIGRIDCPWKSFHIQRRMISIDSRTNKGSFCTVDLVLPSATKSISTWLLSKPLKRLHCVTLLPKLLKILRVLVTYVKLSSSFNQASCRRRARFKSRRGIQVFDTNRNSIHALILALFISKTGEQITQECYSWAQLKVPAVHFFVRSLTIDFFPENRQMHVHWCKVELIVTVKAVNKPLQSQWTASHKVSCVSQYIILEPWLMPFNLLYLTQHCKGPSSLLSKA